MLFPLGGAILAALPKAAAAETFVISCPEDKSVWASSPVPVYATEFVLGGSLLQRLSPDKDCLKAGTPVA